MTRSIYDEEKITYMYFYNNNKTNSYLLSVSIIVRVRISRNITSLSLNVAMGTSLNCTVIFPLLAMPSLWSSMKTCPAQEGGERSTKVVSKVKTVLSLPAQIVE